MTRITITSQLIVSLMGKDMPLTALLNFRTLGNQGSKEYTQNVEGATFADVERFLDATKPVDFNRLLDDYSSASLPLFGLRGDICDKDEGVDGTRTIYDSTTIIDCRNMAALLKYGLTLCHFADNPDTEYDDIEKVGLVVHEAGKPTQNDQASIGIRLEASPATARFLDQGLESLPPSIDLLALAEEDDMLELQLTSSSFDACNNMASLMCEALFNRLSDLMLLDVTVRIQRRSSVAISHSPASSLWLAMLAGSLSGRVGLCENCRTPYVAGKERGQKRRTCSPRCRKALSKKVS